MTGSRRWTVRINAQNGVLVGLALGKPPLAHFEDVEVMPVSEHRAVREAAWEVLLTWDDGSGPAEQHELIKRLRAVFYGDESGTSDD